MSADREEIVANRIRHYLRNNFGFYPTNNLESRFYNEENSVFKKLVKNLVTEVTNRNIVGKNIRHKLDNLNYMVREQAKYLWDHARDNYKMQDLFVNYDATESYVFAVTFAIIGSYDQYVSSKNDQSNEN